MFARSMLAVLVAGVLAVGASDVRAAVAAADPAHPASEIKVKDPAHAEKDPAGFIDLPKRWDLTIYTLAVFFLLFLILYFFAWPNISAGLQKREAMLSAVKDAAEKAKREAEEFQAKLQAEYATAHDKVRAMLEEARRDADALRAKEREVGQKEAASERDRAKREIEATRDAVLQEIYLKAVDLATLISTKAVKKNLNAGDHKGLVDEALAELNSAAPSRN